jgi:hypothetical protein
MASASIKVKVLQTWGDAKTSPGAEIDVANSYSSVGEQVLIAAQLNTGTYVFKAAVYNSGDAACGGWSPINR